MRQLKQPNLNTADQPGWCLRFVGNAFDTKQRPFDRARKAWEGAKFKHTDALPTDVSVPVFFTWDGTIDGETDNWGDVAIWVPGKGVFGTPLRGTGKPNSWFKTVEERAKAIGGKAQYLGWAEDINGVRIAEPSPQPATPAVKKVFLPSAVDRWRLYDVNTFPKVGNEKAFLRPSQFPPGLTYDIIRFLDSGNTVEIQTQMFGRGKIWIKDTEAQIK